MMTPQSKILDRRFPGVGRIKKATGVFTQNAYDRISQMCDDLLAMDPPRLDILRALRDDELEFLQVYEAFRRNRLHRLPIGKTAQPLDAAMTAWIEGLAVPHEASAKHKGSLETSRRYLVGVRAGATVADLPELLEALRDALGKPHPRSFNLARSAALAFVRATLKRNHPLWLACAAVEPRRVPPSVVRQPQLPAVMAAAFPAPATDPVDAIAWAMLTTGMHAKECWGLWSLEAAGVRVFGTKREGRQRRVPRLLTPSAPAMHRRTFENKLRERGLGFRPYDLRRSYANWLEAARIPRTRRRLYLGHAAGDVTDLYEEHEVEAFLAEDATRVRTYLAGAIPATDAAREVRAFLELDPPAQASAETPKLQVIG